MSHKWAFNIIFIVQFVQHYSRPDKFSGRALAFTVTNRFCCFIKTSWATAFISPSILFIYAKNGGTYSTCAKNVVWFVRSANELDDYHLNRTHSCKENFSGSPIKKWLGVRYSKSLGSVLSGIVGHELNASISQRAVCSSSNVKCAHNANKVIFCRLDGFP